MNNNPTRFLTSKKILLPILILWAVTTLTPTNAACTTNNTSLTANISNQSQQSYLQAPTGAQIVILVFDFESHQGIANASVVFSKALLLTRDTEIWASFPERETNSSGYITVVNVGFGTYSFQVSKSGYAGFSDWGTRFVISDNTTFYWEVGLVRIHEPTRPAAPQVPDVLIVVTAITLVILFLMLFDSRRRSARTSVHKSDRSVQADLETTIGNAVTRRETNRRVAAIGKCIVCNKKIFKGQETATCPFCRGVSHKLHLQEWLHVNNQCPACHKKLKEQDLD